MGMQSGSFRVRRASLLVFGSLFDIPQVEDRFGLGFRVPRGQAGLLTSPQGYQIPKGWNVMYTASGTRTRRPRCTAARLRASTQSASALRARMRGALPAASIISRSAAVRAAVSARSWRRPCSSCSRWSWCARRAGSWPRLPSPPCRPCPSCTRWTVFGSFSTRLRLRLRRMGDASDPLRRGT